MAIQRATGALRKPEPSSEDETLIAGDLGITAESLPLLFFPAASWSPLLISFPHVGLRWPGCLQRPAPQVNFARNADYEVHRLYPGAAAAGAASVRARYSRLVVDLNRAADDVSPALVPDHPAPRPRPGSAPSKTLGGLNQIPNRGVLWDTAVGNIPILREPVAFAELRGRLERYYDPYYRALEILLERRRRRFGYAILLEAHSMPSSVPGDLILGTLEGGSCSPAIEALALSTLRGDDPALDVRLNDPYRGGNLVRTFGRPEHGIHALQLEVNRALYMDEATLRVWPPALDPPELADARRSPARLLTGRRQRLDLLLRRVDHLIRALAGRPQPSPPSDAPSPPSASAPPLAPPADGESLVRPGDAGRESPQRTLAPRT